MKSEIFVKFSGNCYFSEKKIKNPERYLFIFMKFLGSSGEIFLKILMKFRG